MNDGSNAKQKIVEKIKDSANILVTVSTDPSVDELSAALGLTLMLNGLNKHATSVVSGAIPPAISFLDPQKTFENTVDSLRDFIIALDKEKADHLRYKVEGDVVKIFVTPYRTTITQEDLDFSQGDYNVEFVLALGVKDESHLDKALEAHGRILHDAAVSTLTCGDESSSLGSISWHESGASSISEMLVALSEALKGDKPILDEQSATAFLTGIVAATNRFSNNKTSSKVMTMAAQLMAAGANQQLIAAKLEESHEISGSSDDGDQNDTGSENKDGTTDLSEGASTKVDRSPKKGKKKKAADKAEEAPKQANGELTIEHEPAANDQASTEPADDSQLAVSHQPEGTLDEVARQVHQQNTEAATEKAEDALAQQLTSVAPAAAATTPTVEELRNDLASASAEVEEAAAQPPQTPLTPSGMPDFEPTFGGTLNATTEQAQDEKRKEADATQNHTILSHASGATTDSVAPTFPAPSFSSSMASAAPATDPGLPPLPDPSGQGFATHAEPVISPLPSSDFTTPQNPVPAADDAPHDQALADVHAVFDAAPVQQSADPVAQPAAPVATPDMPPLPAGLPPLPDFSSLPMPPLPPTSPDVSPAYQPAPDQPLGQVFGDAPQASIPQTPVSNDPNQFKIPGQS